jgi:hypothetical protein
LSGVRFSVDRRTVEGDWVALAATRR